MTKTDEKDRKKLSLSSKTCLWVKDQIGQVKVPHGRSKTVQVERIAETCATIQKPEIEILDDGAVLKHLT